MYNDGVDAGIEQGTRQGKHEERKEIVKTMLDNNMTIPNISTLLKIPEDEIKQLIKS